MDYQRAHDRSRYNREQLLNSTLCGCFSCKKLYSPTEITEWIDEPEGKAMTALCPYCSTDAVIASTPDFPVSERLLQEMHHFWFSTAISSAYEQLTPDEAQVALLQEGVEAWNLWRAAHAELVPHLDGAVLKGLNLQGANFHGAYLRQADLKDANLSHTNLQKADLQDANFCGAKLERANLNRTHCKSTQFAHASLVSANLSHAHLVGANLSYIDGTNVDLRDADLSSADVREATLLHADCRDANFFDASLEKADLTHADLRGADFSQARLQQAQLLHVDLKWSKLVMTNFTGAVLKYCSVDGAFLWKVQSEAAQQCDLVFEHPDPRSDSSTLSTDDLVYAYFMAILLANPQIESIVDSIITKGVMLLGDWREGQEEHVEMIKHILHDEGYMPLVFHDHMSNRARAIDVFVRLSAYVERVIIDQTRLENVLQMLPVVLPLITAPIFILCHPSMGKTKELERLVELYPQKLVICNYLTLMDMATGIRSWLTTSF